MSGWLWGNSSDSTNSSNSMNNEQQTQANIQPPMGGQQPPLFVLEQLKHAGVPLKAQMTPYLQVFYCYFLGFFWLGFFGVWERNFL